MEYVPVLMKLAEVLPPDVRTTQIAEVARLFRMPLHKIMQMDRATWGNVEQMSIEYVQGTLRPWLISWEQEMLRKLRVLPAEHDLYFEFLVDSMLRGDQKSRYEAYAVGRQQGFLSANDIRTMENMDPIEGGDSYLVPLNMQPAQSVGAGGTS
jgi:HK97 family phage portal protein